MYANTTLPEFKRIAQDHRDEKKIKILLNSPGGQEFVGAFIAKQLTEWKQRGIEVEVHVSKCHEVSSAAPLVIAAGSIRTADETARFGFHGARNIFNNEIMSSESYIRSLSISPLVAIWLNTLRVNGVFDRVEMTWITATEMKAAGFLTNIEP